MFARSPEAIGNIVRRRRAALGLSQQELGDLIGQSRQWVSQLEAGADGSSIGKVFVVLRALGIRMSLDELPEEDPFADIFDEATP